MTDQEKQFRAIDSYTKDVVEWQHKHGVASPSEEKARARAIELAHKFDKDHNK